MKGARIMVALGAGVCVLRAFPAEGRGDIIEFKQGGKKECVIVEETDESVKFLTSMGTCTMPRERIESIKHQSDKANEALEKSWKQKKTRSPKKLEPEPEPVDEEPKVLQTHDIEITKRRIMLGGRDAGVRTGIATAKFKLEDFGMVEGSRLFRITVTSYRNPSRKVRESDFYGILHNDLRVDSEPLEGYESLEGEVSTGETVKGYVAFPQASELKTIVVRSDLAEFDLDVESGDYSVHDAPF